MKILMLGWELPPHKSYGLGVACYHIAKALASEGAKIDFVVPYTADHPGIDFMTVHGATKLKSLDHYGFGPYDKVDQILESCGASSNLVGYDNIRAVQQSYIRFVEYLVTDVKPDVIHVHDWLTMEAGVRAKQLTGVPLVVHVHATEYDRSGGGYGNPLAHEIEYQGLIAADKIIAVSNYTKQIIMHEYGIPSDKIEVVYHALDSEGFDKTYEYDNSTYKYLETLKKEGFTIVSFIGRLTLQKGLTFFLKSAAKAVAKYDKFAFLIAGDGEQRDELIRLATDLGIIDKVFFTGFINGQVWRDAFNISDIFVMSSISEPFGLTALEAAYHKNAVIVTKQSGVGEVLDSVFKYDFWDEDALADELIGLAVSPTLLATMKDDVGKEYNAISWDKIAKKFMNIYGALTKGALHE